MERKTVAFVEAFTLNVGSFEPDTFTGWKMKVY